MLIFGVSSGLRALLNEKWFKIEILQMSHLRKMGVKNFSRARFWILKVSRNISGKNVVRQSKREGLRTHTLDRIITSPPSITTPPHFKRIFDFFEKGHNNNPPILSENFWKILILFLKEWNLSQLVPAVNLFKDTSPFQHYVGHYYVTYYPNFFGACGGLPRNFGTKVPPNRLQITFL